MSHEAAHCPPVESQRRHRFAGAGHSCARIPAGTRPVSSATALLAKGAGEGALPSSIESFRDRAEQNANCCACNPARRLLTVEQTLRLVAVDRESGHCAAELGVSPDADGCGSSQAEVIARPALHVTEAESARLFSPPWIGRPSETGSSGGGPDLGPIPRNGPVLDGRAALRTTMRVPASAQGHGLETATERRRRGCGRDGGTVT